MVYGLWYMVYGVRYMVYGVLMHSAITFKFFILDLIVECVMQEDSLLLSSSFSLLPSSNLQDAKNSRESAIRTHITYTSIYKTHNKS